MTNLEGARFVTTALAAVLLAAGTGAAQEQEMAAGEMETATAELPADIVEDLRKDVATLRMDVMQQSIQLDPAKASTFWSIYEEYLDELDTRVADRANLLRDYALGYDAMTDEQAVDLGNRALELDRERLDLLGRYFERIEDEVDGLTAGQFYQIERRTDMVVDLGVAREVPIARREQ